MPTINNYTANDFVFSVTEGTDIYDTRQTATVTLTPNQGFTLVASDFTRASGPVPLGLSEYEFVQNGDNVDLIMTFEEGFEMPSNNIDMLLCVEGAAREIEFWTKWGWVAQPVANASWSFSGTSLSEFGAVGDTITVIYTTLTANPGSKLTSTNIVFDFPNESFAYTETKLYDVDGNWTSSTFIVTYTFEANNFVPDGGGDGYYILLNGTAEEIFVEEPIITAYNISTSAIPAFGGDINITIYGNPGATFSIERFDPVGSEVIVDNVTLTEYSYSYLQTLPSVATDTVYEFEITGDLSDTFDTPSGQSSAFFVYQNLPITINLDATGTGLQGWTALSRTYNAYSQPIENSAASVIDFVWNITSTTASELQITSAIDKTYWSNLQTYSSFVLSDSINSSSIELDDTSDLAVGMLVNAGTTFSNITITDVVDSNFITVSDNVTYLEGTALEFSSSNNNRVDIIANASLEADLSVTITGQCIIYQYGSDDVTFELDLDQFIEEATTATCIEVMGEAGPIGGSIDYLDCSSNPISLVVAPNEITPPFFMLSGSATVTGDIIISLATP